MEQIKRLCFFGAIIILNFSCNFQNELGQAILEIDATTNKMRGTTLEMKDEVEKLQKVLPDKVKDIIDEDLNSLVQSAVNSASNGFKCDVEFVRTRLRNSLLNIKAKLTLRLTGHEKDKLRLISIPPTICDCNPLVIDQDKKIKKLILSGFDISNSLKIVAIKANGKMVDLTKNLAYPNDYNIIFKVDQNFLDSFERLRLSYPNMKNRDVLILRKTPILCKETTINATPNPGSFSFTADVKYGPGDAEFKGHGPDIVMHGKLYASTDKKSVMCHIDFNAVEVDGDGSAVSYSKDFSIYTVDSDQIIVKIISPDEFTLNYRDDNEEDDEFSMGFVSKGYSRGDHDGPDIGVYTGAKMNFTQLKLIVSDYGNGCLSQLEINEILKNNSVLYADFKKLDSLSRIK